MAEIIISSNAGGVVVTGSRGLNLNRIKLVTRHAAAMLISETHLFAAACKKSPARHRDMWLSTGESSNVIRRMRRDVWLK